MKKLNLNKYIVILLSLTFILGVTGCKETTLQDAEANQSPQKQLEIKSKINPSFETKEYNTPFVQFLYPSNFKQITLENNPDSYKFYYDKNTIIVLTNVSNKELKEVTIITFKEIFDPTINNSDQARKKYIKDKNSMVSFDILDDKSYLKNNIAICDGVIYNTNNMHVKTYFWNNNKGKTYQIEINTYNDNWNNIGEILQVFEQSLKFKK